MRYSYFPGCSLEKNAHAYHQSTLAVAKPLGLELVEIEDWNCCGATEYISLNLMAAYALVARNLALAARTDGLKTLVAPCSACYLNLTKVDTTMREYPALAKRVNTALAEAELAYTPGSVKPRHLLDVIYNDVGCEALAAKVTRPLSGLRIAPYYGCFIARPGYVKVDDTEFPTTLDHLLKALGAEVVDYPMKATCCGGHMTQISETTGFDMIRRLVKGAADREADLIVTICPMCQLNLDAFQGAMNRHFGTAYHIPVLYFTQMIGVALGLSMGELGIGEELVDSRPALSRIGSEMAAAAAAEPHRARKDDKTLPMPAPLKQA
jgi:heterodisulfide reductase subunit B